MNYTLRCRLVGYCNTAIGTAYFITVVSTVLRSAKKTAAPITC
uniref:Uncharacterized protein n=1 Tax=Zea mays TaxID=4577 RepID=C4J1Z2_MAIZE|nr:unknown [Zea mays]